MSKGKRRKTIKTKKIKLIEEENHTTNNLLKTIKENPNILKKELEENLGWIKGTGLNYKISILIKNGLIKKREVLTDTRRSSYHAID